MRRTVAIILLVVVSYSAGLVTSPAVIGRVEAATPTIEQPAEFALFWQAWKVVQERFVYQQALDPLKLTHGAIRGMITALGDEGHTRFLTPSDVQRQTQQSQGSFEGIGAEFSFENQRPVVVAPLAGSPAEKAGLRPGDVVLEVNGQNTFGWDFTRLSDGIRGPKGTSVTLKVLHRSERQPVTLAIVRDVIRLSPVSWTIVPDTSVGLIKINSFSQGTSRDLATAISQARQAGAASLVIDLRNNPGGLLQEAIGVIGNLVGPAVALYEEDRDGKRRPVRTSARSVGVEAPLVVLVNRGSASASEIVAGAIQDHKRGEIIGATTVGTGTVLSTFALDDGSAILLGIAQWLTPNGRVIRKVGIEPDIFVYVDPDLTLLTPAKVAGMTRQELDSSNDNQLVAAVRRLTALTHTYPPSDVVGEMEFSLPLGGHRW